MPHYQPARFFHTTVLIVAVLAFASGSAWAQQPTKELPYKASAVAKVKLAPDPTDCQLPDDAAQNSPCRRLIGQDTGNGTHLGQYHSSHEIVLYWKTTENGDLVRVLDGSTVIVSANGDKIYSHYKVQQPAVEASPKNPVPVKGHYQIEGGTGRFDGAGGSGEVEGFNLGDDTFVYESTGTISIVPGSR